MSLIKDILGVTHHTVKGVCQLNENIKKEAKTRKPANLNREVYSLCGDGTPPLAVGIHGPFTGKKNLPLPVSHWVMASFTNPARSDKLQLKHWCKEKDLKLEYPFAKYNFVVKMPKYNDALYEKILKNLDPTWTKEETDHLWELCERFDLRFHVVFDRYNSLYNHSIEQLKQRYYSVAKKIVEYQFDEKLRQENIRYNGAPPQHIIAAIKDEKARQPLIRFSYSIQNDQERKIGLEKHYTITDALRKREAEIIEAIKVSELKIKKHEKKKEDIRKLKKNFEVPEDLIIPISPFQPFKKPCSTMSSSLLEQFRNSIPRKFNDQIDYYLNSLSVKPPLVYSQCVVEAYCSLRIDVAIMLNLKRKVESLAKEKEYWEIQVTLLKNEAQKKSLQPCNYPLEDPNKKAMNYFSTVPPQRVMATHTYASPVAVSPSPPAKELDDSNFAGGIRRKPNGVVNPTQNYSENSFTPISSVPNKMPRSRRSAASAGNDESMPIRGSKKQKRNKFIEAQQETLPLQKNNLEI